MIVLQEGETLPIERWVEKLRIEQSEFNQLLQRAVFKPVKSKSQGILYRLTFVGEIAFSRSYAISIPKCVEKAYGKDEFELINKTIKKYFEEVINQKSVASESLENLFFFNDSNVKEIEVYLTLKSYFLNKGVYKKRVHKSSNDIGRPLDWKRTLTQSIAYISDDSIIYPNAYTKRFVDEENIISEIFKAILSELTNKYEKTEVKSEILHRCESSLNVSKIRKSSVDYCNRIRLEASSTYNSDDLLILSILREFLEDDLNHKGENIVRLFGTSSFHVIWEHICAVLFENQRSELYETLNQPIWKVSGEEHEKGKFLPDVMVKNDNTVYIIDAKYYYPVPQNVCGVSDLAKQFIYAQIYNDQMVKNIFVFPTSKKLKLSILVT